MARLRVRAQDRECVATVAEAEEFDRGPPRDDIFVVA